MKIMPAAWRTSIVCPILKHSRPANQVMSYRPIPHTPCVRKIIKLMMYERLEWMLESTNVLPQQMADFL